MMTDKILQKIQELETEIINADFPNVPDVKNKVRLMLENLSKMEKMVFDIKEEAAIDNIMATHNCSRNEAMFIHLNADGIDYVDINFFISKGQYGLIHASRTKNVELSSVSRPRSSYVYWRLVDGKKEYIWKDEESEMNSPRKAHICRFHLDGHCLRRTDEPMCQPGAPYCKFLVNKQWLRENTRQENDNTKSPLAFPQNINGV